MGLLRVYDSLYSKVSKDVQAIISKVLPQSKVQCIATCIQKQDDTKDCGLFAMAVCTFLAFGRDPSTLATHHFDQTGFRYLVWKIIVLVNFLEL